jgi:hypothetical protein
MNSGKYKLSRFFWGEDDLIRIDGKTFAISNQWDISNIPALQRIAEAYPNLKAHFVKAEP